jgi:hypothetical protein
MERGSPRRPRTPCIGACAAVHLARAAIEPLRELGQQHESSEVHGDPFEAVDVGCAEGRQRGRM